MNALRRLAPWLLLAPMLALLAASEPAHFEPARHAQSMRQQEMRERFDQAVLMLHAKQYEHAVTALHRVLELAPAMPEAHVNMGYALLGQQRSDAARGFFEAAIELKREQANAYYGLALAHEQSGDLESALGSMRAYLHLSRTDDAHRTRARSALWEWEGRLGRRAAGAAASQPAR
jgi:tetratricopeptide (TPR) repeat protein